MSEAADRLARTRLAIIEQAQGRSRSSRDEPAKEKQAQRRRLEHGEAGAMGPEEPPEEREGVSGWFGHGKRALGTWWRHHPAHMGVELATPLLSTYANRRPVQYLAIAAALGAVVVVTRPWRVITVGGLLAALLKSSQVTALIMSALSAADFQKDRGRPYE